MKILLTGATGYVGQRLLPLLLEDGHQIVMCVRDKQRIKGPVLNNLNIQIVETDFLKEDTLKYIPQDIDIAYYLIHSMATGKGDFENMEERSAINFRDAINRTNAKQVIYLSGIVNESKLSEHLRSRKKVEDILAQGSYSLTTLRAGIVIGSGSASFEIIRDLVEKLPVMIAPKWVNTLSQPIAVHNVLGFLKGVLMKEFTFGKSYDIGGPDVLSYKDMLLKYGKVRGLSRRIGVVPVMTPRLSSYWLYFVTSTSYSLAVRLVDSMKIEVICRENDLAERLGIELISYEEAIRRAFEVVDKQKVLSTWKDALTSQTLQKGISYHLEVPEYGCYKDYRKKNTDSAATSLERIWSIGGANGWYFGNWLWGVRGFLDKLVGGVGLRRGRNNPHELNEGEALDFWRVLVADKENKRLLLYAEMKLPGEGWLEFRIDDEGILHQTATFRPLGLWGRIYWYLVLPFHGFIFGGMLKHIARGKEKR